MDNLTLGTVVLRLRHKAGMTQQDLVQISGVSLASITRVENGESCRIQTAIAMLHAFQPLDGTDLVDAAAAMQLAPHVLARKLDMHAHRTQNPRPPSYVPSKPAPPPYPTEDVLDDIRDSHGTEGLRGALAALEAMTDRLREMLDEPATRASGMALVDRQEKSVDGTPYVEERRVPVPLSKTPAQLAGEHLARKAVKKAKKKA